MAGILGIQGVDMPLVDPVEMKAQSFAASQGALKDTPEGLKKVSQEFESFFLFYMLKEMRKTVNEVPLFHGGRAEEIFQGMMDEHIALSMAQAGGIGLAPIIYQQLSRVAASSGTVSGNNDTVSSEDEEK